MAAQKDHSLKIGSSLLQYRIVSILGSGGFGITYKARDEQLDKLFAITEFFPADFALRVSGRSVRARAGGNDDFVWAKKRFIDEARILARFQHTSIVGVVRIFDANNTAYIVQEFQSGRSLKEWLQELDGPPTQDELDLITEPILSALDVIHRNDVLHRDIAPDNIYIRDDGSPVLLDFGSAREAVAQRTKTISAVVKSGYSPAEQYSTKGKGQGPWSDIYALAATLYRAVTGEAPEESTERILSDDMVPTAKAAKGPYRESFLQAIDWALKVVPSERPQSVAQWKAALLPGAGAAASITTAQAQIPMSGMHSQATTYVSERVVSGRVISERVPSQRVQSEKLGGEQDPSEHLAEAHAIGRAPPMRVNAARANDSASPSLLWIVMILLLGTAGMAVFQFQQNGSTQTQDTPIATGPGKQIDPGSPGTPSPASGTPRSPLPPVPPGPTAEQLELQRIANLIVTDLCRAALDTVQGGWSAGTASSLTVAEARRRNLGIDDCRKAIGMSTLQEERELAVVKAMTNKELCDSALTSDKRNWETNTWGTNSSYASHTAEARRRSLSVDECRRAMGLTNVPKKRTGGPPVTDREPRVDRTNTPPIVRPPTRQPLPPGGDVSPARIANICAAQIRKSGLDHSSGAGANSFEQCKIRIAARCARSPSCS